MEKSARKPANLSIPRWLLSQVGYPSLRFLGALLYDGGALQFQQIKE
jgi:hypothetical protein